MEIIIQHHGEPLGLEVQEINENVIISSIADNSPASKSNLQVNDCISNKPSMKVTTNDLLDYVLSRSSDDSISLFRYVPVGSIIETNDGVLGVVDSYDEKKDLYYILRYDLNSFVKKNANWLNLNTKCWQYYKKNNYHSCRVCVCNHGIYYSYNHFALVSIVGDEAKNLNSKALPSSLSLSLSSSSSSSSSSSPSSSFTIDTTTKGTIQVVFAKMDSGMVSSKPSTTIFHATEGFSNYLTFEATSGNIVSIIFATKEQCDIFLNQYPKKNNIVHVLSRMNIINFRSHIDKNKKSPNNFSRKEC